MTTLTKILAALGKPVEASSLALLLGITERQVAKALWQDPAVEVIPGTPVTFTMRKNA